MTRHVDRLRLLVVGLLIFLVCGAAYSLGEGTLGGIKLDSPPSALLRSSTYGNPDGVIASGGVFNTLRILGPDEVGQGGLPHWAYAIRMEGVGAGQVIWAYNRTPAAIGFLLTGEGADAHVSSIVASLWKNLTASAIVETKKGIRLGDTFTRVLLKYGFPKTLSVLSAPVVERPAAGPGALPAVAGFAGAPGFVSGPTAMGTAAPALRGFGRTRQATQAAMGPSGPVVPTYAGAAPGGVGQLPPATPLAPQYQAASGQFAGAIMGQSFSLSRHMVIGYPDQGVEFALYDMRVVRIQVFPVAIGQPTTTYASGATTTPTTMPAAAPVAAGPSIGSAPGAGGAPAMNMRFGRRR